TQAQHRHPELVAQLGVPQHDLLDRPADAAVQLGRVDLITPGDRGQVDAPVLLRCGKRRPLQSRTHHRRGQRDPVELAGDGGEHLVHQVDASGCGVHRRMRETVTEPGKPAGEPEPLRIVPDRQHLDRGTSAPDVAGEVLPLDELEVVVGPDRRDRHGRFPAAGSGLNDTPQYRCCWPLRATVTRAPEPLVPVLAAHLSARGLRAVCVTPLWSSRYRSRANSCLEYWPRWPGSIVNTDQMSTSRTTASTRLPVLDTSSS